MLCILEKAPKGQGIWAELEEGKKVPAGLLMGHKPSLEAWGPELRRQEKTISL